MDPSEFEGTVERKGDALSAGTLEVLLTDAPQFVKLDLSKESDEIYMTIFNVKESLNKWDECSLSGIQVAWDEQAMKIAELKEEVSVRKKTLAAKIRQFVSNHLSAEAQSTASDTGRDNNNIQLDSKELIDSFKTEFDHLINSARYSETAFLAAYKHLRGVKDPSLQLEECLRVCIRAQETLKNAQEQLNIAAIRIGEAEGVPQENNSNSSYANNKSEELRQKEFDAKLLEQGERYKAELVNMRAKFDNELRNREHDLRSTFERQQMEHQEQYDKAMARKDSEISSLLASLNEYNQRNMEGEERQKMLESEVAKRRELEEKLRSALTDLATSRTSIQELQSKYDASCTHAQTAEAQIEATASSLKLTIEQAEKKAAEAIEKLTAAEIELQQRPPVDLSYIADSLGMAGGEHLTDMLLASKSSSLGEGNLQQGVLGESNGKQGSAVQVSLSWQKVEQFVVESVRRTNHEATEIRVKEQEVSRKLRAIEVECAVLKGKLKERDDTVSALEKDLVAAHQVVEANKALLKCYNNSSTNSNTSAAATAAAAQRSMVLAEGFGVTTASSSLTAAAAGLSSPAVGVSASLPSPSAGKRSSSSSSSSSHYASGSFIKHTAAAVAGNRNTAAAADGQQDGWGDANGDIDIDDDDDDDDVEKGSGGRGTAAAVLGIGATGGVAAAGENDHFSSSSSADRMMQAVQAQRDRFMKVARDKEAEVNNLRIQVERAQSEQVQLRNDNLELYQRLRLLRAQGRGGAATGAADYGDDGPGRGVSAKARLRKDVTKSGSGGSGTMTNEEGDEGGGDAVDRKYMRMYEDRIDPFKLEELDRQSVLSRMNVFERALAYVTRFFLQDQWARHALLVYLLLVHCFALGYVIQVLNPQLIEEVDSHMKAKWESQTFDMDMNREHPDV